MPCMFIYDHRFLLIDDSTAQFAIVHHNLDRYRGYVLQQATEESKAMATNLRENEGKKSKKSKMAKKDRGAPSKDPVSKMKENMLLSYSFIMRSSSTRQFNLTSTTLAKADP